jgi:hypothetical protein
VTGRRAVVAATLAVAALSQAAGPAHGAYAPKLRVEVAPATPATPASLVSSFSQTPGESSNRTIRVRFPPTFTFNPGFTVAGCTADEEASGSCPEASRIGEATVESELGTFTGPVHFASDYRLLVYLRSLGLIEQKIVVVLTVLQDGSIETVLDNLADVRVTSSRIALEGGSRSLFLTPASCGPQIVEGRFTSHAGEEARSDSRVEIAGCDTAPEIRDAIVAPARARRGTPRRLSWGLSQAGSTTDIRIERMRRTGPRGSWQRWRRVLSASGTALGGENELRLHSIPGWRALAAGTYRAVIEPRSARGRVTDSRAVGFRIIKR